MSSKPETPSPAPHFDFEVRASDSPLVALVWRAESGQVRTFHSVATANWEIVFSMIAGVTRVTVRGPETRATQVACPPDGEFFGVQFKLGVFMPELTPAALVDSSVDLPLASPHAFRLDGSRWDLPGWNTVEEFVRRLAGRGLLREDAAVSAVLEKDETALSQRSLQRHALRSTGLPLGLVRRIELARTAAHLLRDGTAILDAVDQLGYADQAHLTRSLRRYLGETPRQLRLRRAPSSLLPDVDHRRLPQ